MQPVLDKAPIYWSHEAIAYLGIDRLGLVRPDMALQRLIKKGALSSTSAVLEQVTQPC